MKDLFPSSYEESRARFLGDAATLRERWKDVNHQATTLSGHPSLSMDVVLAEPATKQNLIILSTGLHGIEGYVGSAMLKLFIDQYLPRLNAQNTGLLFIHAINPFGMNIRRRYNENNVDLNRNFIWEEKYDSGMNPEYDSLFPLLNPQKPVKNLLLSDAAFVASLIKSIFSFGIPRIKAGTLAGQYRHQAGIQFGGIASQETAAAVKKLLNEALSEYQQVVHIDLHTGYGPRYQMSMVNSTREPRSSGELSTKFGYPLVLAATPSEFYEITGDVTEYLYKLRDERHPVKELYATGFEFGTFGDSLPAQIRSLRATILENRNVHHPSPSKKVHQQIRAEYEELFLPTESKWREKAIADCIQGYNGILSAYGLIN